MQRFCRSIWGKSNFWGLSPYPTPGSSKLNKWEGPCNDLEAWQWAVNNWYLRCLTIWQSGNLPPYRAQSTAGLLFLFAPVNEWMRAESACSAQLGALYDTAMHLAAPDYTAMHFYVVSYCKCLYNSNVPYMDLLAPAEIYGLWRRKKFKERGDNKNWDYVSMQLLKRHLEEYISTWLWGSARSWQLA